MQQPNRLNDEKKYSLIVERMSKRGVELHEIAEITYELQPKYLPNITREICLDHVKRVVMKREVQNAVLTGIELDLLAE